MREAGQPLIGRGKSLVEQLLRIAQTRLELLSVEIQQEKLALVRELRLAATLAVCALLAAGAVASAVMLNRASRRGPLFGRVIHQLRLDRASLMSQEP